jgi:hypothetical protein
LRDLGDVGRYRNKGTGTKSIRNLEGYNDRICISGRKKEGKLERGVKLDDQFGKKDNRKAVSE